MPGKFAEFPARSHIPNSGSVVCTSRSQDRAIWAGSHVGDLISVPGQRRGAAPRPVATSQSLTVWSRHLQELTDDDFFQPGEVYRRVMTDTDREHLIGNIVAHLGGAQKRLQLRQTSLFFKADPDYGRRVTEGLGLVVKEVERLAAMSQEERVRVTSE